MRQLIVFLFAFLIYSDTFHHSYVLDDNDVIANNGITRKGIKGIPEIFTTAYRASINNAGDDLYRPLSKALFAIEWEVWPDKPSIAHIINVVLYALLCTLFYVLLLKVFREPLVPFIAALLFAVHPIHTEVVSNIKSADEILALLFSLLTLYLIISYSLSGKLYILLLSVVSFFTALLAKESAVVFIAIIPLTIYFFTGQDIRKNLIITTVHLVPLLVYMLIRHHILADHPSHFTVNGNYLIGIPDFLSPKATAIMLLGYYLLLLIIPYRLMSDGSFSEFPVVSITDLSFILPFLILMALLVYAIINFRAKKASSYSILFFFVASSIVSNIFILIGTNYGERLMFVPSAGICILFALIITRIFTKNNTTKNFFPENRNALLASLVFILPYSFRTVSRAADWKDSMTLYRKDALSAPNSARAQYYLGNQFAVDLPAIADESLRASYVSDGIVALNRAVKILPGYDEAYYSLGEIYSDVGNLDSAAKYYQMAALIDPLNARFQNNYGDIMFKKGSFEIAKKRFELAVKYDSTYRDALINLGTSYAMLGQQWLEKAKTAQSEKNDVELNRTYGISMTYYDSAIVFLNRSVELDRGFFHPYYILGVVYQNMNDQEKAKYYYAKADELKNR